MKNYFGILGFVLIMFGSLSTAGATLTAIEDTVVFDSNTGFYWVWDVEGFAGAIYSDQMTTIAVLSLTTTEATYANFSMASAAEMLTLEAYTAGEIDGAFNVLNTPFEDFVTPGGRYDDIPDSGGHWAAAPDLFTGPLFTYGVADGDTTVGAWAVTNPIPEPSAIILLAAGLVGLAGIRRKFKKV